MGNSRNFDLSVRTRRKITVSIEDLKKASPVHGVSACAVCIKEYKQCKSRTQHVEAWIRRNRFGLDKNQHLYMPESLTRFVSDGTDYAPQEMRLSSALRC
jgi:hypothetical protein